MKTIVVGDLHGRVEVVEAVLKHEDYNIIFIGDYLDSYDRPVVDQMWVLDTILAAVRNNPDRVYALRGNHELSYQDAPMRCSGYNYETQHQLGERDLSPLLDYMWVDEYLISHAGVSQRLLDAIELPLKVYLTTGVFDQIGRARGGRHPIGGLFWCDWWEEFTPVKGVPQIVGHSNYRPEGAAEGITRSGNSYNIDCLERVNEVLVLEKGKLPAPCSIDNL
jgi:hypothetical protein